MFNLDLKILNFIKATIYDPVTQLMSLIIVLIVTTAICKKKELEK